MDPSTALQIKLTPESAVLQEGSSVEIQITVHNNAAMPITLLKWGTPLDPQAGILGVFEVRAVDSDEIIQMDTIRVSRMLPPTPDDLQDIPAGSSVEAVVKLPPVSLQAGREYSIRAQGGWQAVWEGRLEDVSRMQLDNFTGARAGGFVSDKGIVKVE